MKLVLEINDGAEDVEQQAAGATMALPNGNTVLVTPPIGEDYWLMRVKVSPKQAIVGFPKFMTIGIGFAVEDEDWNTNLPYTTEASEIPNHIWNNHRVAGDTPPTRATCLAAIRVIQAEAHRVRGTHEQQ